MHYKNGTPAAEGDHVITRSYNGKLVAGVIFGLQPGNATCNCNVSVIKPGGVDVLTCQNVGTMYRANEAFAAIDLATSNAAAEINPVSPAKSPVDLSGAGRFG